MTEIEKLHFQTNIENIKHHVRNALMEYEVHYWVDDNGREMVKCSGCGSFGQWEHTVTHEEDCEFIQQEKSRQILEDWAC